MSWSASVGPVPITDVKDALATATTSPPTLSAEPLEQFELGKAIAVQVADSGAVGAAGCYVVVSLCGHGNPGHEPTAGWGPDTLNVAVTQATVSA